MKLTNKFNIVHVTASPEELDELERGVNYTATGDGVLLLDVDSLENAETPAAGKLLEVLPKKFGGLVFVTR
jgi:hypothetical protein